jgi:hypothetical protein
VLERKNAVALLKHLRGPVQGADCEFFYVFGLSGRLRGDGVGTAHIQDYGFMVLLIRFEYNFSPF